MSGTNYSVCSWPGANSIYGNTLATLVDKNKRKDEFQKRLTVAADKDFKFTRDQPSYFNPYPDYNTEGWREQRRGEFVPCEGPDGQAVGDLLVFPGHPHDWPDSGLGSYDALGMDGNLCFERESRLGPYGYVPVNGSDGQPVEWAGVKWGELQNTCVQRNQARFLTRDQARQQDEAEKQAIAKQGQLKGRAVFEKSDSTRKEGRTAVLLRSFTSKKFTENDKQNIRAMISELSLRSGGEYQVYLLVHVKDHPEGINDVDAMLEDPEACQRILNTFVPAEFHDITVLWDDQQVWKIYTALDKDEERNVHEAQWLSVQKFSRDHPEFEFIWNWEMDFRFTGHNYEMLNKLHEFGAKQPRKGLWERNERYYVPSFHGKYDSDFRRQVETASGKNTVWGPYRYPFMGEPVGPEPPVADPKDDAYEWGVGEDADYITLAPMFNPVQSRWIMWDHVWGYSDDDHKKKDLPRRTTIVTHSRLSKRLLQVMHDEEMRGNHVASEMTPQTVALLHGLKAVFAPHPVFFDRPWEGSWLQRWFNPGPLGVAGGSGSSMGWGRERRYEGSTWYYRAIPPNRLYNNWMGYIDTAMGGKAWEQKNGRPCLPPIMLHPIKDVKETSADFRSVLDLAFG